MAFALFYAVACVAGGALATVAPGHDAALLQTWGRTLAGTDQTGKDTPVARVVKLLKEMQATLQKEMDEDAALMDKLACWCNNNKYEKTEAISETETKISDLTSTISSLDAKSKELTETIQQLESDVAEGKKALETAAAIRAKEASEFKGSELDSIQAVENLKAAIKVLSKHVGAALPQTAFAALPPADEVSFLATRGRGRKGGRSGQPLESEHESQLSRSFDMFLKKNGFSGDSSTSVAEPVLVEQSPPATTATGATWSEQDTLIIQRAMKTASAFMQAKHSEEYYPSYQGRSGEIIGILKELKEQMEGDLSESQKTEMARLAAYQELRTSKETEVEAAEKQAEQKEDQLATTVNELAEAKEDKGQSEAALFEAQGFVGNLKKTCEEADANFEQRKSTRLEEIKAVSDTISILMEDEARDTMSRTYSFLQLSSASDSDKNIKQQRHTAASLLSKAAAATKNPSLSVLATSVQLDSFTRVKKAIDEMVIMLKQQQADEVKKVDWCKASFHENDVTTVKTEQTKSDLSVKSDDLASSIQKFSDEIKSASKQIDEYHVELQRATENRQAENVDFQATIADQQATQAVLKQALERLSKFYESEEFLQKSKKGAKVMLRHNSVQTPPVAQAEYKPSAGSSGVMSMIEKLIYEAKELEAESKKSEQAAQAQYEALVADTSASVKALEKEITFKTGAKADAAKEKTETEADLVDTVDELEGLDKYKGQLHSECDYMVKNFDVRQEARAQEVEALQQAKQVLSGAAMS